MSSQVEAMELKTLTPDMPQLLTEMGVRYDPQRLADALRGREIEISARAVQVATMLGGCIAGVAKVRAMSIAFPCPAQRCLLEVTLNESSLWRLIHNFCEGSVAAFCSNCLGAAD
jgi:hypothetical protein